MGLTKGGGADVVDSTQDAVGHAGEAVADAPRKVASATQGNPVAVGLIAFGVGLLAASLIPASRPEQRAAVVLRYYVGFSAEEIAEMLGIPIGTAKSRIHYATEALRAALEADGRASAALVEGRTA